MTGGAPDRRTILISGGTVVNAEGFVRADVLIAGERIVGIGVDQGWQADEVIDATGKYIMPGGIDAHTHLEYPIDGFTTRTSDDFATGSVAAAFGGTTMFIDFVKKHPEQSLFETFADRRATAEQKSIIDFGLHAIVPPLAQQPDVHDDLRRLRAEQGASSWKFFMAYPGTQMVEDDELLAGMDLARELGALPMVHAENGHMINRAVQRLLDDGNTAEVFHAEAHGHASEAEAVHRAIVLAEEVGTPLYIVHVSSRLAAAEIASARSEGLEVWGETCPQYLLTAREDYEHLGEEAAGYICSPPIRERENQDDLWRYLCADGLSTLATDHAAFCMHQTEDLPPQKLRSPGYFPKTPNGVPGLEDRLMVVWEAGVASGRMDMCRFVEVTSARPAKLFGLYPQKGTVSVGADADLIVWDPAADHVITSEGSHSRTDYNLYEGMRVTGLPVTVLSRGRILIRDRELQPEARQTRGRYLERGPAQLY
ncbi:dihydropyrimidinase [Leucobacter luti]|uniref:Dihydropyrimidinase n=1 Tax=Leucobacter luti TaxID=340320 RepID=A0A4Q7U3R2_9MICO|nr:dihydropyrimidinase [Leucobacter luti]MBL3699488.1 dihydropyrimidinase [Leucobacter luti]RZT66998.1 dihydropyrimidinase [Leucobacter luti]